jgi:hypothetical protein
MSLQDKQLLDEIVVVIAAAKLDGGVVAATVEAQKLLGANPGCSMTRIQIEDEILLVAAKVGVAVEIGER